MDPEKLSPLAKYAYGYSDEKPGWSYWLVWIVLALLALGSIFKITHR